MLRLLWLTNNAAPYRRRVWERIGSQSDLRVSVLESDAALRKRARRGEEWTVASAGAEAVSYSIQSLRAFAVGRGERLFHVLVGPLCSWRSPNAILIGGWDSPAYWQALMIGRIRRARIVGFYESTLLSQRHSSGFVAGCRNFFFRRLDAVVVPGIAARNAVVSMGVSERKVHVGFNAVDVQAFRRPAVVSAESGPGHRFLYVGQLIERKNVAALIRAFASMRADIDTLTIVGAGPQRGELLELVANLGLQDAVVFRGPVAYADLPRTMWEHHTLVLPSLEEVWGLVVNEALAAGLHTVISDAAGVSPSVCEHPGTFISSVVSERLAKALVASRDAWHGPIEDPEVLQYTPQRFAEVFLEALKGD